YLPGPAVDPALAQGLFELGLVLVLFGLGLQSPLGAIGRLRPAGLIGAGAQFVLMTGLGAGLGLLLGWDAIAALLLGLVVAAASGALAQDIWQQGRVTDWPEQLATGWLASLNLAVLVALVVLVSLVAPAGFYDPFVSLAERLGGGPVAPAAVVGLTLIKLAAFAGCMLALGR